MADEHEADYVAQLRALLKSPDALGLLGVALQTAREQGVAEERARCLAAVGAERETMGSEFRRAVIRETKASICAHIMEGING